MGIEATIFAAKEQESAYKTPVHHAPQHAEPILTNPEHGEFGHVCDAECQHTQEQADQFAEELLSQTGTPTHGELGHVCDARCIHAQEEANKFSKELLSEEPQQALFVANHEHGHPNHICTAECQRSQEQANQFAEELLVEIEAPKHGETGHVCDAYCEHKEERANKFAEELLGKELQPKDVVEEVNTAMVESKAKEASDAMVVQTAKLPNEPAQTAVISSIEIQLTESALGGQVPLLTTERHAERIALSSREVAAAAANTTQPEPLLSPETLPDKEPPVHDTILRPEAGDHPVSAQRHDNLTPGTSQVLSDSFETSSTTEQEIVDERAAEKPENDQSLQEDPEVSVRWVPSSEAVFDDNEPIEVFKIPLQEEDESGVASDETVPDPEIADEYRDTDEAQEEFASIDMPDLGSDNPFAPSLEGDEQEKDEVMDTDASSLETAQPYTELMDSIMRRDGDDYDDQEEPLSDMRPRDVVDAPTPQELVLEIIHTPELAQAIVEMLESHSDEERVRKLLVELNDLENFAYENEDMDGVLKREKLHALLQSLSERLGVDIETVMHILGIKETDTMLDLHAIETIQKLQKILLERIRMESAPIRKPSDDKGNLTDALIRRFGRFTFALLSGNRQSALI